MQILAIEGHDGSGKTSVAQRMAARIGAKYVKPYDGLLGDHIAWCWKNRRFDLAHAISRSAVERQIALNAGEKLLVFDRHWLTMFTVLPEVLWQEWSLVPTILCWTSVESTRSRLLARGEVDEAMLDVHEYYCKLYRTIAEKYSIPVIDTTLNTVEESVEQASLIWSKMLSA
jgi:thymidylate kinase